MRQYKQQIRQILALTLAISVLCTSSLGFAASKSEAKKTDETKKTEATDISGAVTQTYNADPSVQIGMLVRLKEKDGTTVTPLTSKEANSLLGVVVPKDDATIVITPGEVKAQQVLVATTGTFSVLVSNQNGPVNIGDYLSVSALSGIAMKADENQARIIGKATSAFSGTSNVVGTVKLKDSAGRTKSVSIGRSSLDIKIAVNPLFQKNADFVPGFAAKIADSVSSKPVSVARIYLGMALIGTTAFVTAMLLYSGVRSGMVAVGRNPLSKKSIFRSLIQTVIAGLIIFATGIFAVYLLLKL
jgi:hypothetical protein